MIWFVSKFMLVLIIGTIADVRGESEITGISKIYWIISLVQILYLQETLIFFRTQY